MTGALICITGVDGAGKSTQANRLVSRLRHEGYRARYVWAGRRAVLTAPFVNGGKQILHAPKRPSAGTPSENHAYRSYQTKARRLLRQPALQVAWRTLAVGEHVLQLMNAVELPLLRGEIVVCDRYLYDTLINQMALLHASPWQLAETLRNPFWRLLPRPALGFWLDIPAAVAVKRKTDIYDAEQLTTRAPLYATLASELGFVSLDATRDADTIAASIWKTTKQILLGISATSRQQFV